MDYTGYCYEKRFTFFDSFGVEGLKNFMITDDKKTIQKILSDIEKMMQIDDKITLVNIKFSMRACETLTSKEIENLSDTARDFFYFIQAFGNFLKVKDTLNIWMVEDPIQDIETVTCGIFKLYFYENLFNPKADSKIQNNKKLTKKTVETSLNKLFYLDIDNNENIIRQGALDRSITLE